MSTMTKPAFKTEPKPGTTGFKIVVKGHLTISHAAEIKSKFLKLLEKPGDIDLILNATNNIDIVAIQLIYLLNQELKKSGHRLTVVVESNPALQTLLSHCGLTKFL